MKKRLGRFLYFSRAERRGILLLGFFIVATLCILPLYRHPHRQTGNAADERPGQPDLHQEYETFATSVQEEKATRRPWASRHDNPRPEPARLNPFPFDPNRADSADFRRLGLSAWTTRNILRYRQKGGTFHRPADFRKIYGLTAEQYRVLAPYIRLTPPTKATAATQTDTPWTRTQTDTLWTRSLADTRHRHAKYPAGTVIELNGADTTELMKIPGIGRVLARRITGYRQRLGGFHHIGQLKEINLNPERLRPWFRIDTTAIRRLRLNRLDVERLRRHPYLNFFQARAIVEWRKKNGRLSSLKPFLLYDEFTEDDFRRLAPYVSFD